VQNNTEVRKVLGKRGIEPEWLPPAEDLRRVERRLAAGEAELSRRSRRRFRGGRAE
jgi:DNA-damage-inducible protein D